MTLHDPALDAIGDALALGATRRAHDRRSRVWRSSLVACALTLCTAGLALAAGVDLPNIVELGNGSLSDATITSQSTTQVPLTAMDPSDRLELHDLGAGDLTASLLAVHGDDAFWRLDRKDGGYCFTVGSAARALAGTYSGGVTECGPQSGDRPFAPDMPLRDLTIYHGTVDGTSATAVDGFAADQIAKVGLVDLQGNVYETPVSQNVYYLAPPDLPVGRYRELIALDAAGTIVYRQPMPMQTFSRTQDRTLTLTAPTAG